MGIKGLSQFLYKNFPFQEVTLHHFEAVVIDGNNICSKLYEKVTDWKMGGEYREFTMLVQTFFETLIHVQPIVVFDGLREVRKIEESCKRREDVNSKLEVMQMHGEPPGISVTPTLALSAFLLKIQEMGIELHVSAGEGDRLVAAISNSTPKCPVLASDSDYFMYELQNGYIPFDKLDAPTCLLYHKDQFQAHFHLQDPMMRLIIPAKHGNDFIPSETAGFQNHHKTLKDLSKYKTSEEYLSSHDGLRPKYETAVQQYCVIKSPTDIIQDNVGSCPNFIISTRNESIDTHFCLIRISTTRVYVMNNAIEKISRESVWNCSQYIRQYMYGFMGISEVEEITRKDGASKLKRTAVQSRNLLPPITVSEVVTLTLPLREEVVLTVLKFYKMPMESQLEFKRLPAELKLPVATAFYWYLSSDIADTKLVQALLLCFVGIEASSIPEKKQLNLENLHAFSQWQSVYSDALALNYMMRSPLHATDPGMIFSGKKALHYTDHLPSQFSGILIKMFAIVVSRKKKKDKKYPAPSSAATAATSSLVDNNPFSLLSKMEA